MDNDENEVAYPLNKNRVFSLRGMTLTTRVVTSSGQIDDREMLDKLIREMHLRWKQREELGDSMRFQDEVNLVNLALLMQKYLPLIEKLNRLLDALNQDVRYDE
jgi:hypothetical protein